MDLVLFSLAQTACVASTDEMFPQKAASSEQMDAQSKPKPIRKPRANAQPRYGGILKLISVVLEESDLQTHGLWLICGSFVPHGADVLCSVCAPFVLM